MLNGQLSAYTNEQLSAYTNRQLAMLTTLGLVFDRTNSDVERWRELRDKGWDGMTENERREWIGEIIPLPAASKGMYTHNDLNRVESTVEQLVALFRDLGYKVPDMYVKTDWTYEDDIRQRDMNRYLTNIEILRKILRVFRDTPRTPTVYERFDYMTANNIEKILYDLLNILENIRSTQVYSGEIVSGEV